MKENAAVYVEHELMLKAQDLLDKFKNEIFSMTTAYGPATYEVRQAAKVLVKDYADDMIDIIKESYA